MMPAPAVAVAPEIVAAAKEEPAAKEKMIEAEAPSQRRLEPAVIDAAAIEQEILAEIEAEASLPEATPEPSPAAEQTCSSLSRRSSAC